MTARRPARGRPEDGDGRRCRRGPSPPPLETSTPASKLSAPSVPTSVAVSRNRSVARPLWSVVWKPPSLSRLPTGVLKFTVAPRSGCPWSSRTRTVSVTVPPPFGDGRRARRQARAAGGGADRHRRPSPARSSRCWRGPSPCPPGRRRAGSRRRDAGAVGRHHAVDRPEVGVEADLGPRVDRGAVRLADHRGDGRGTVGRRDPRRGGADRDRRAFGSDRARLVAGERGEEQQEERGPRRGSWRCFIARSIRTGAAARPGGRPVEERGRSRRLRHGHLLDHLVRAAAVRHPEAGGIGARRREA